jgi:stage II sporulation protein AA (anti-sigma F factor antagonist)
VQAVTQTADGEAVVVFLTGELDAGDRGWAEEIQTALDGDNRRVVVDLLNVTFIDSSVVQELILAYKRVGEGGWLRLVYTHHLISRVIEICGLADTFPQYTTVDAALRSAPTRVAAVRAGESAGPETTSGSDDAER